MHDLHNIFSKLHMRGRINFYQRPHAQPQSRCTTDLELLTQIYWPHIFPRLIHATQLYQFLTK